MAEPPDQAELAALRRWELAQPHFPWLAPLRDAQRELAELVSEPSYTKPQSGIDATGQPVTFPPYRDAEVYYWTNVPRWIWEDVRRRPDGGDFSPGLRPTYMSAALLERYPFHFQVCNVELDPLPFAGPFDQIIFTEIVEHLNFHPVPTLRKLAALLSDGGRLYLTTPDADFQGRVTAYFQDYRDIPAPARTGKPPIDGHIYQYRKSEMFDVLAEAGLEVERFDYTPGYLGYNYYHLNFACRRARTARETARSGSERSCGKSSTASCHPSPVRAFSRWGSVCHHVESGVSRLIPSRRMHFGFASSR